MNIQPDLNHSTSINMLSGLMFLQRDPGIKKDFKLKYGIELNNNPFNTQVVMLNDF